MISIFGFFIACASPSRPRDKQTEIFAYYLQNAFNDSIPPEKRTWILVPENGCKGCRQGELELLHRELIADSAGPSLQYIFSPRLTVPRSLVEPLPWRVDEKGLIDRINLPLSNITIVRTEKGAITLYREISAERMDSIPFYLR